MRAESDFRLLDLKPSYYTNQTSIAKTFYEPVLSNAVSYDRVSGYFSGKAFAHYAKGIQGLVRNGGRMRLIISEEIAEEDFLQMTEGYRLRRELEEDLLDRLDEKLSLQEEADFSNLAHLIARGVVDVRVGFIRAGLFHSKFGLVRDAEGNILYFTGSNNETRAAIEHNYESFDVTGTWLCSDFDRQKIDRAIEEFESLWSDGSGRHGVRVREFEELVLSHILRRDKGKIILDKEMLLDDALVLTLDQGRLVVHDRVAPGKLRANERTLTRTLVPFCDGGYPTFRSDLTYMEIKKVISHLERLGERRGFEVVVTERLRQYLGDQEFMIEERAEYARLLKSSHEKVQRKYETFSSVVDRELERKLRERQMRSAFYMVEMQKAANFSVPGAGKTSMIYGAYAYLSSREVNKVERLVVIGPKNTFISWKDEFRANFGDKRDLRVLDIHDSVEPLLALKTDAHLYDLILVNYESLGKYERVLSEVIDRSTMLVFDEVHKIKGLNSIRAKSAKALAPLAPYKFVLTGTPIPNTYEDIYNFLNILYGEEYKSFFNFKPYELKEPNESKVQEVNMKLAPFFWRTNKRELGVPDADDDILYRIVADDTEQRIIDLLYRKYRGNPFALYIRLIQAASSPELVLRNIDMAEMFGEDAAEIPLLDGEGQPDVSLDMEEIRLLRSVRETRKFRRAIDTVTSLHREGKTAVVWCMFVHTIDRVHEELLSNGIRSAVIYGSTPQEERERLIRAFQNREFDVIVTNPHTLAESVSLHHVCHDAVYLEYSFNLTHMLQSRDRIHRLGLQEGQYTRYHYMMMEGQPDRQNMVDEKIYIRLKEKEQRMLEAIENGELRPDPNVNYDDIVALFD
ncbi:SNF2-related protein [Exiguobacterium algae]|uniref:SNF2-related protein n=1 Tax=Exiguobacterium algae TaxID=2751250 RepID=UPI001BE87AA3|nr:SNF2-related protein [Exiguobacterium algae]